MIRGTKKHVKWMWHDNWKNVMFYSFGFIGLLGTEARQWYPQTPYAWTFLRKTKSILEYFKFTHSNCNWTMSIVHGNKQSLWCFVLSAILDTSHDISLWFLPRPFRWCLVRRFCPVIIHAAIRSCSMLFGWVRAEWVTGDVIQACAMLIPPTS